MLYRLGLGEVLARARLIVLTTRGRKSGLPRHTIVEYRMHGNKIYVISGWGDRPNWVQNLQAYPLATMKSGPRRYQVEASRVENTSEVLRALFLFRQPAPQVYDSILARMTEEDSVDARKLPQLASQLTVLRLDITSQDSGLRGVRADLAWVWGVALIVIGGGLALHLARKDKSQETL
jgi:deazaflavin-dependent oxidoreductase (nitroreductase family)